MKDVDADWRVKLQSQQLQVRARPWAWAHTTRVGHWQRPCPSLLLAPHPPTYPAGVGSAQRCGADVLLVLHGLTAACGHPEMMILRPPAGNRTCTCVRVLLAGLQEIAAAHRAFERRKQQLAEELAGKVRGGGTLGALGLLPILAATPPVHACCSWRAGGLQLGVLTTCQRGRESAARQRSAIVVGTTPRGWGCCEGGPAHDATQAAHGT